MYPALGFYTFENPFNDVLKKKTKTTLPVKWNSVLLQSNILYHFLHSGHDFPAVALESTVTVQ